MVDSGVRQPSLYKHIDGIDGLQRGIAMQSRHELAATLSRAAIGRSRGEAIMSMAHAYRAWALKHPGRYAALRHAPAGDGADEAASNAIVQITLDVLAGFAPLRAASTRSDDRPSNKTGEVNG
jgi:hypothetical protein